MHKSTNHISRYLEKPGQKTDSSVEPPTRGEKKDIQSTPLNRVTSVRGHFDPIKRRTLLTENIFY